MTDISPLAELAYAEGVSPIDYAVGIARTQLKVQAEVLGSRSTNPDAYPGYHLPLTDDAVAHRIVGDLLDAGWQPPQQPTADTPGALRRRIIAELLNAGWNPPTGQATTEDSRSTQ